MASADGSGYKLIEELGRGAFGKVYKAECGGSLCAIKKMSSNNTQFKEADVKKEVDLLKFLDHAYIIKYQNFYVDSQRNYCLVMEFADCGTLSGCILKNPDQPEWHVWRSIHHMSDALEYLGRRNIIHRDIKPDNILGKSVWLDRKKGDSETGLRIFWKLSDFGISKLLTYAAFNTAMGYYNSVCGTPIYMAPEVVKAWNEGKCAVRYSSSVDIWSLGAVISFYCNRGNHLFSSPSPVLTWPGDKSSLPRHLYSLDLRNLTARMLSPNPANRPTAAEVKAECNAERQEIGKH